MSLTKRKPPVKGAGAVTRPRTRKPAPATPPAADPTPAAEPSFYTPEEAMLWGRLSRTPGNVELLEIQSRLNELLNLARAWQRRHGKKCRCLFCGNVDRDEYDSRGALAEHTVRAVEWFAVQATGLMACDVIPAPRLPSDSENAGMRPADRSIGLTPAPGPCLPVDPHPAARAGWRSGQRWADGGAGSGIGPARKSYHWPIEPGAKPGPLCLRTSSLGLRLISRVSRPRIRLQTPIF